MYSIVIDSLKLGCGYIHVHTIPGGGYGYFQNHFMRLIREILFPLDFGTVQYTGHVSRFM